MIRPAILVFAIAASASARESRADVTFAPVSVFPTGSGPTGIATWDFDGDGDRDLATSNRATSTVSILFNDGAGSFSPPMHYPAGSNEPRYVVAADFDGDGDGDIATCNRLGNKVAWQANDGTGVFSPVASYDAYRANWIGAADIDDDGDVDLLVTYWDVSAKTPGGEPGLLMLLRNDGTGDFEALGPWTVGVQPRGGAAADLDGDGALDVVVNNLTDGTLSVFAGDGAGGLSDRGTIPSGFEPRYIAAADYDGDARIDLAVVQKEGHELWIHRNLGDFAFTADPVDRYPTHTGPHSVVAADLDDDGDADIAVSETGSGTTYIDVFVNDGTGVFAHQEMLSPSGPAHVIASDLDGDGRLDLATANVDGPSVSVHLNRTTCTGDVDGDGHVGVEDLLRVLSDWGGAGDADLDHDGVVGVSDLLIVLAGWGLCG